MGQRTAAGMTSLLGLPNVMAGIWMHTEIHLLLVP